MMRERAGDPDRLHLRVLLTNESHARLAQLVPVVAGLGHEVIARAVEVDAIGAITRRELPDVALVSVGESSAHALNLIGQVIAEAACPVIALIHDPDPDFVNEASKRGVFAAVTSRAPEEWQNALDVVLRRFAEHHALDAAFSRQAVIERAKGILMERHALDADAAFELLRRHARQSNRKLTELAAAVTAGHPLLPRARSTDRRADADPNLGPA